MAVLKKKIPWDKLTESKSTIPDTATVDALSIALNRDELRRLSDLEYVRNRVASCLNNKENYEQLLARYMRELTLESVKLEKLEAQKPVPVPDALKTQIERLTRHKMVKSVVIINGNRLRIFLQPLFTQIRTNGGSRTEKKAFIGCYIVDVALEVLDIRVKNLSFVHRHHWSCSNDGEPCLGSWDSIKQAHFKGKWFDFVTLMVTYLQSTADSAAYMYAHSWRDKRVFGAGSGPFPVGAKVRFSPTPNDDSNDDYNEQTGTIIDRKDYGEMAFGKKCLHIVFDGGGYWWCTPESLTILTLDEARSLPGFNEATQTDALSDDEAVKLTPDVLDTMTQEEANANYKKLITVRI